MAEEKENRANLPAEEEVNPEIIEGEIVEEGDDQSAPPVGEVVPVEEYNALVQDLEKAQEQAKANFDGWQRERADFANYKRRIDRDQQSLAQNIAGEVVKKYLTVLDDMERALQALPGQGAEAEWAKGVELIYRKLQGILEAEGVKRIPAEGEQFDPTIHEAITYEESPDHESGQVIGVLQQGYRIGDRVLRPALVRVAR